MNKILHGDSLELLKDLDDNSVDSLVTDPPYGYGFMGKDWDTFEKKKPTKSDLNIVFLKNKETNNYKSIKNKIFVKSKFDINKIKIKGIHNISSKSGYGVKNLLNNINPY